MGRSLVAVNFILRYVISEACSTPMGAITWNKGLTDQSFLVEYIYIYIYIYIYTWQVLGLPLSMINEY